MRHRLAWWIPPLRECPVRPAGRGLAELWINNGCLGNGHDSSVIRLSSVNGAFAGRNGKHGSGRRPGWSIAAWRLERQHREYPEHERDRAEPTGDHVAEEVHPEDHPA